MKNQKPKLTVTTWEKAPQVPADGRPARSLRPMRSLQGNKSLRPMTVPQAALTESRPK